MGMNGGGTGVKELDLDSSRKKCLDKIRRSSGTVLGRSGAPTGHELQCYMPPGSAGRNNHVMHGVNLPTNQILLCSLLSIFTCGRREAGTLA